MTDELLSTAELCDNGNCPAVAAYEVTKGELKIAFCRHHFHRHEPALVADGWATSDESVGILEPA